MPAHIIHSPVHFHFLEGSSFLSQRSALKSFIAALFKKERKSLGEIHYIFCSDGYLLEINKQYLKHNYYTDIITFDLSESRAEISGEVYISVDRVKDNAAKFGESLNTELARVVFHGALHLCGYGDKTAREKEKMKKVLLLCSVIALFSSCKKKYCWKCVIAVTTQTGTTEKKVLGHADFCDKTVDEIRGFERGATSITYKGSGNNQTKTTSVATCSQ